MGLGQSREEMAHPPPSKMVLVPPMFERDLKARSRFAKSSYDYLFSKKSLKWLMTDYLDSGASGVLLFSPPADPRISVKAKVGYGARQSAMNLRFQPLGPSQPNSFIDIRADPRSAGDVALRGSFFDPQSNIGAFMNMPLAKQLSGDSAQVGMRYSSPVATAGIIAQPRTGQLSTIWLGGKYEGIQVGLQLRPNIAFDTKINTTVSSQDALEWFKAHASYGLSYTPPHLEFNNAAGQGSFTASVEVQEGRHLVASFFQHLAVSRRVLNPFEQDDVIGITNYINIGMQIVSPISNIGQGVEATSTSRARADPEGLTDGVNIAASWQVNKNWLVKGRVGNDSAAVAVGLRSWFQPSLLLAACARLQYATRALQWGLTMQIENFGALRYERGAADLHGRALIQRHEATEVDIANATGQGPLVRKSSTEQDYNVRTVDVTANYL